MKWLETKGFPGLTKLTEVIALLGSDPHGPLTNAIQNGIDQANKKAVSNAQKVQKWVLLEGDFSTVMNELTPTLKLKRAAIAKKYKNKIDTMYPS